MLSLAEFLIRSASENIDAGTNELEHLLLYSLMRGINARTVIEIGTRRGHSGVWLARAIEDNSGGRLFCIDPFNGTHGSDGEYDQQHAKARFARFGLSNYLILPDLSRVALPMFDDSSVDAAFIDGDHSYSGVSYDFSECKRIVRDGGLVMMHDISNVADVVRFVSELADRKERMLWLPGGLGGLAVYQKVEKKVADFLPLLDVPFQPSSFIARSIIYDGILEGA